VELREVLRRRRMVRRFDPDRPVGRPALDAVLYAAQRAPSAGFSQGWDFVVLAEDGERDAFWSAVEGAAVDPAPADAAPADAAPADAGRADAAPGSPAPSAAAPRAPDAWLRGVSAAPVLVLCLSDPDAYLDRYAEPDKGWTDRDPARWPVPYWDVDTGMAAMAMLLAAVDEGLGALFFGVPPVAHDRVRGAHGIPANRRLVGVVALGHERARVGGSSRTRPRRPAADVVHWGRFGRADHGLSGVAGEGPSSG
jgi:nitroreductase